MLVKFSIRVAGVLLASVLALGLATAAAAQTISQPLGTNNSVGVQYGQSFTATVTGTVTQISVRPRTTQGGVTLAVYNGVTTGQANGMGVPVSQQTVNLVDTGSDAAGFNTFVLTTPLPVTAGQTYSFAFNSANLAWANTNPYPAGIHFAFGTTDFTPIDLAFEVVQVPTPPATVPTLSEWTLILLGLMMASGAAIIVQRRRLQA